MLVEWQHCKSHVYFKIIAFCFYTCFITITLLFELFRLFSVIIYDICSVKKVCDIVHIIFALVFIDGNYIYSQKLVFRK